MASQFSSSPNTTTSIKKRFDEVDSLRAVACTLVILFHAGVSSTWLHKVLINTLGIGTASVVIFFAISGFVIPDSLRGKRWNGIRHFAIRRFWRLYPPFWLALLLSWWLDARYEMGRLLWDAVMLPTILGPFGSAFRHFWTLEVELIFYILIAVLFLLFRNLGWKVLLPIYLILSVLASIHSVTQESISYSDRVLEHITVMLWGGIFREILRFDFSRWHCLNLKHGVNWKRSSALGVITALLIIPHITKGIQWGWLISILGVLFWLGLTPVRITWLSQVGRWTYSTYLFHYLVIVLAHSIFDFPILIKISDIPMFFAGLCLLISFVIGAFAYRWIEQPSDAIGKRLTKNRLSLL